jgi:hypothetical protein
VTAVLIIKNIFPRELEMKRSPGAEFPVFSALAKTLLVL